MQNVRQIPQNAGHTRLNDGHTMQNNVRTTHNVGRNTLNFCQGPMGGLEVPPRASRAWILSMDVVLAVQY